MFYLAPFGPDHVESYDPDDESQPFLSTVALRTLNEATLAEYPQEYVAGVRTWAMKEYEGELRDLRELRSEADRQRRERFAEWALAVCLARQCENLHWLWRNFGSMKEPVVISEASLERYSLSSYSDRWHLFSYEDQGGSVEDWDWSHPRSFASAWLERGDNNPNAFVGSRSSGVPRQEPWIEGDIDTGPVPLNRFIWDRLRGLPLGRGLSASPTDSEIMRDALDAILRSSVEHRNELAGKLTRAIALYLGISEVLAEGVDGYAIKRDSPQFVGLTSPVRQPSSSDGSEGTSPFSDWSEQSTEEGRRAHFAATAADFLSSASVNTLPSVWFQLRREAGGNEVPFPSIDALRSYMKRNGAKMSSAKDIGRKAFSTPFRQKHFRK